MQARRKNTPAEPKPYRLAFSLTSLIFYGVGLFVLLGWIFSLGIMVGRGMLPEGIKNLAELKDQIAMLQSSAREVQNSELKEGRAAAEDPEFRFHETLSRSDPLPAPQSTPKPGPERPSTPAGGGDFTVQVASLNNGLQALKLTSQLVDRGYPAYFHAATAGGKALYRVRCGKFKSEKEARELAAALAGKENMSGFVTTTQDEGKP